MAAGGRKRRRKREERREREKREERREREREKRETEERERERKREKRDGRERERERERRSGSHDEEAQEHGKKQASQGKRPREAREVRDLWRSCAEGQGRQKVRRQEETKKKYWRSGVGDAFERNFTNVNTHDQIALRGKGCPVVFYGSFF